MDGKEKKGVMEQGQRQWVDVEIPSAAKNSDDTQEDAEKGKLHYGKEVFSFERPERRKPLLFKYLFYIVSVNSALLVPGLVCYFGCIGRINRDIFCWQIDQQPFFKHCLYAGASWTLLWVFLYISLTWPEAAIRIINLIDRLMPTIDLNKATRIVEYAKFLRSYLAAFYWAITNVVVWSDQFPSKRHPANLFVCRLFWCLAVACGVLLVEKTFIHIFSVNFHKISFRERMELVKSQNQVLERLNEAATASDFRKTTRENISSGLLEVTFATLGVDLEDRSGIGRHGDPYRLSRRLFEFLTSRSGHEIILEDMLPFFESREATEKAFKLFDTNKNGSISRKEFLSCILEIYESYAALESSMRQSSQAISKLDILILSTLSIVCIFIFLGIFAFDVEKLLTISLSVFLGTTFAIGDIIKNLVESVIFCFFSHPFDIGDRVIIEREHLFVKRFGLLTTHFIKWDGKELYHSNVELTQKPIYNIRRSGPLSEEISLSIDMKTPTAKMDGLRDFLVEWIKQKEYREIEPRVFVYFREIFDLNRLDVRVVLFHKVNWQDTLSRLARRSRFMDKLREGLIALDITLIDKAAIELANGVEL